MLNMWSSERYSAAGFNIYSGWVPTTRQSFQTHNLQNPWVIIQISGVFLTSIEIKPSEFDAFYFLWKGKITFIAKTNIFS